MTKTELLERLETLKTEQEAKACLGCHYIKPECEKTCVIIEEAIKAIKAPHEGEKHGRWINFYGDFSAAECSICVNAQELLDELAVAEVELKNDVEQKFEECIDLVFDIVRLTVWNCKKERNQ